MIACCLSVHAGDIQLAQNLMRWIARLGGVERFDLVIVADAGTPFDQVILLKEIADKAFATTAIVSTVAPVKGWPTGSNANWTRAAQWAKENNRPFLHMEPDAVPLCREWLLRISDAYEMSGQRYLGHIYDCKQAFMPERIMSGIAVYPPTAINEIAPLPLTPRAWDVDGSEIMVKAGMSTELIRHLWGTEKLAPVFVEVKDASSPINALTLSWLPPGCVLFHRDKTHSLIKILSRRYFPQDAVATNIVVVFPVCGKDVQQAIHHAKWLSTLGKWNHKAVIAYDYSAHVLFLNQLSGLLNKCFEKVESFVYPAPPIPNYPQCANWCWQAVAHQMARGTAPWLFLEADAVILKRDWITQLQREYDNCAKAFMGAVVPGMGHINGTAVYPANAAMRMPRAMSCGDGQAFDMVAKDDMGEDRHDCGHLFFHTWSIVNENFCPVGGGRVPSAITPELAATIPKTAVAIHRIKDHSLIDLLMSGRYKHE